MKKLFEWWKIWAILSALMFVMTCWLVAYSATSNTFSSWKTDTMWSVLTEASWNKLMDELDSLRSDLDSTVSNQGNRDGESIPGWMIVAFYDDCPTWWDYYTSASVPGPNSVTRKWCVKWTVKTYTVEVHSIVPYKIPNTDLYAITDTTAKYFTEVPEGSSVSISDITRTITVWSSTWTAPASRYGSGDGISYPFSDIMNYCGATVTSSCKIDVYYKKS